MYYDDNVCMKLDDVFRYYGCKFIFKIRYSADINL